MTNLASQDNARATSSGGGLALSAAIVAGAFVLSRMLGLVREVAIANRFGTSGETGAYVAAFRVPDLLFLVVMAGSFGSAFIPIFGGYLGRGDRDRAWRLANAVLTLAVISMLVLSAVAFVFADPIIRYLVAPDLEAEYRQLAVDLMRRLLLSPMLLGLGIAAKGILEAQDRFLFPALAPLVYNGGIIFGALVLSPRLGIEGLAYGVILGAAAHFSLQIPSLWRAGLRYRPVLSLQVEGLGAVGKLLLPRVIGQTAFQINFIVVTAFASRLGSENIAAFNFAWQLLMLPHGVLALSISTVIFPTMSRQFERGDIDGLRRTFGAALRPLIYLSCPAAVGLFMFREPITRVIYESGAFDRQSTALVVAPLGILALGLISYALVEVLVRAFYAMRDAKTPVVAALIIIVINLALCAALVDRLGLTGLAIGLTVSTAIEAIILGFLLFRRLTAGGVASDGTFPFWAFRVAMATLVLFGVSLALQAPLLQVTGNPNLSAFTEVMFLGFAIAISGAAFAFVSLLGNIEELTTTLAGLNRRLAPIVARSTRRVPGPNRERVLQERPVGNGHKRVDTNQRGKHERATAAPPDHHVNEHPELARHSRPLSRTADRDWLDEDIRHAQTSRQALRVRSSRRGRSNSSARLDEPNDYTE